MATKSRAQLIDEVLSNVLGVVGIGQSAEAEDRSAIDGLIDPAIEELAALEVIRINDDQVFDLGTFRPLASFIGELAAPGYGRPSNPAAMEEAKQQMRMAIRGQPTFEVQRAEYF